MISKIRKPKILINEIKIKFLQKNHKIQLLNSYMANLGNSNISFSGVTLMEMTWVGSSWQGSSFISPD
jgi:hypothetical protein